MPTPAGADKAGAFYVTIDDLDRPEVLRLLRPAFSDPDKRKPDLTVEAVTEEAASGFGALASSLYVRSVEPQRVAHLLVQVIFFGILHSRAHEVWSLRMGTWLGVGNDQRQEIEAAAKAPDNPRRARLNPPDLVGQRAPRSIGPSGPSTAGTTRIRRRWRRTRCWRGCWRSIWSGQARGWLLGLAPCRARRG